MEFKELDFGSVSVDIESMIFSFWERNIIRTQRKLRFIILCA